MRDDLRRTTSEVSPERIREYHRENSVKFMQEEAVHLRLILLSPKTDEPTSVLMQEAERIIERLEAGEPFEALAREASDDEKAEEGGDWGWISRGDLRSELVEPAFSLEEGQHSEPVVVDGNVFILYVEKRRDEGVQPLENVRDEIEEAISAHLARRAQQRWLERLREEAYVKYFVKDLMAQR
jgi:peptidyl-prolyl cis-trans isomerase SurA